MAGAPRCARWNLIAGAHLLAAALLLFAGFLRSGRLQGWTPPPDSAAYGAAVAAGRRAAASKCAIFGGLTRNGVGTLPRVLDHLRASGALFADYRVVVFENDSDDGTDELLQAAARADPRLLPHSEGLGLPPALARGGFHQSRFRSMARFRRKLLAHIDRAAGRACAGRPTVYIIADLDLHHGWRPDALATSFAHPDAEWDVMCANGVVNDGQHWDTLALRTPEFNDTRQQAQLDAAHLRFPLRPGLIPVHSCFGGVAIYKPDAFRGCRYPEGDDCEHVLLHRCMRARGRGRVFVNPVFLVQYGVYLPLIIRPLPLVLCIAYFAAAGVALARSRAPARRDRVA